MKYIRGRSEFDSFVIAQPVTTQKGIARRLSLLVALCLALACEGAIGYAQSTFGSIIGTVQDPSGAVVPGALVHVQNMDDNTARETHTNDAGAYLLLNLNPGSYSITASAENFVEKTLTKVTLD